MQHLIETLSNLTLKANGMPNQLEQLKKMTTVVADTGDIEAIAKFSPQDATTNPSLLLKAASLSNYQTLLADAVKWAKEQSNDAKQQIIDAADKLSVLIGLEILNIIPGRISTEVDARLSFDTQGSIDKAHKLIALYNKAGISNNSILIKLASTWEGIKAAEQLEKEGINCNLTLLFSFAQARACAGPANAARAARGPAESWRRRNCTLPPGPSATRTLEVSRSFDRQIRLRTSTSEALPVPQWEQWVLPRY